MFLTPRRLFAGASAVALLLAGPVAGATASTLSPAATDPVAWAVGPSDGTAADGRTAVELDLDPGESTTEYLVVTNLSDVDTEFTLTAADGYITQSGRFNMLPVDHESTDAGTWISFDSSTVEVAAGRSSVVRFVIDVPDDAMPGDHPAGVAASVRSVAAAASGAAMAVDSRVGFRVMTRVVGELRPALMIDDIDAHYETGWNPFEPGAVTLAYTAENTGNTRISTTGSGDVSGPFRVDAGSGGDTVELLPGDRHRYTATVDNVWPLGFATVQITVDGDVVPTADGTPLVLVEEVMVWAVPWSQLAVLAGLALIVFAALWGRRRQSVKVAKLVADAREAGARESRSMPT